MVINMLHTLYVLTIMDTTVEGGGYFLTKNSGSRASHAIEYSLPMTHDCVCVDELRTCARRRPEHHEGSQSADRAVLDILCVERDMIGRAVETEVRGSGWGGGGLEVVHCRNTLKENRDRAHVRRQSYE